MKFKKGYVITGDVVNFTRINSEDREVLIQDAKLFLEQLVAQKSYAQVFRGDSYQLFFSSADSCLDALIKLKCWFLTYKNFELSIRNAIGAGDVAFMNENILQSDGEAFHLSGRTFDGLSNGEFLVIKTNNVLLNAQLNIITLLLNIIIDKWTVQQAEVVLKTIEGFNQTDIAKELGISQGAVNNRLKLSNWKEVKKTVNYLKSILENV